MSGPGQAASGSPVILGVKVDDGESEMKVREVLVKVFEPGRLRMAWQQVRANAGAAGIDQMTVAEFAQREDELLALIHDKLASGSYRFQPARRVEIPKPGTSKTRKLGIPVVMDRIVGTSMHNVLEERFDADFVESLIAPYLNEAKAVLAEGIVADAELIDAGLIFGTGFAPFRGGPLHYLEQRQRT